MFLTELAYLDSIVTGQVGESGYSVERMQRSMELMEQLTGLLSKADGTYFGRLAPVRNDIVRWRDWFNANRDCLYLGSDSTSILFDSSCLSLKRGID